MFHKKEPYYLRSDSSEQRYHMRSSDAKIMQHLKMNLISRSLKRQALAITNILKIIKSNTSSVTGEILIGADIPGLLCDIMNNHNPKLIMKVFFCLSELANHKEFYGQRHSMVVVETTCRTIRILASEGNNSMIIHKGIELLIHILSRCKREVTINLSPVMEIVSVILGSSLFQGVHLVAISLLRIILQAEDFDHKDLPDLIYLSLTLFYKLRKNNVNRFTKYIKLALEIMSQSLRYFLKQKDMPLAKKACNVVWSLTESFVIPSLKELDLSSSCGPSIVMKKLNCINEVYEVLDEKKLYWLSNTLAAEGYLILLPDLDQQFENAGVHKGVIFLLYNILARLASSLLKFPAEICHLIGKGLKKLPIDLNKWPDLLAEAHSEHVHMTVITHLYFALLVDCCDSLIKSSTLLPAFSKYLLSLSFPPFPALLKAITFVFAVSSLSCPHTMGSDVLSATRKLVKWLKCTNLGKVFTHHPAMLYWFFSAQVNDKTLQLNSIILWMQNKSPAAELKDLVLKIDEAALRLLDLLSCCSEKFLKEITLLIKVILDSEEHLLCDTPVMQSGASQPCGDSDAEAYPAAGADVPQVLWQVLAANVNQHQEHRHTTVTRSAICVVVTVKNICCVINLSCRAVPHNPAATVMLRLTQQLVQTFHKSCGKSWQQTLINTKNTDTQLLLAQLFKLTHTIIGKMNLAKDYRGLKMFLEEESLRRGLLACLDSDNKVVTHPALKLLTYLQQSQKLYNIEVKNSGTLMGAEFLLKLMSTKKADTAIYVAELFSTLRIVDPKRFITLSNDMSITTIHTLYLEFLNLTVRPDAVCSLSWSCERKLLQYCHNHNQEMEVQLLNFPLNNLALRVAFKKSGIGDPHLAEYLYTYVRGVKCHGLVSHSSYARALCRDPVSSILTIVAEQLLTNNWPADSLQSCLIYQICKIGGNIPPQTMNALKLKIPRQYKKKIMP